MNSFSVSFAVAKVLRFFHSANFSATFFHFFLNKNHNSLIINR
ncbi:hypothetical protein HMPREF9074_09226 [Capnocytophaga sp. oral taxon 329 str. F0087]|nr:hypothetical protein HMPREF9074_09226 [Capnocytophaga sp. oral taxon 329 str. F0087]